MNDRGNVLLAGADRLCLCGAAGSEGVSRKTQEA
jgi:hypothetical protein